jgi:elongation factor P hydroxylase
LQLILGLIVILKAHSAQNIIELFNRCFRELYNCVLIGGADEPVYLPANNERSHNQIHFAQDYFASALHEIAHWCIAGSERRKQVDYGYWYIKDGRSREQQANFESVEVYPQAIEAIFAQACGYPFKVSIDNLEAVPSNADEQYWLEQEQAKQRFERAVAQQKRQYLTKGMPKDARYFAQQINAHWSNP